MEVILAGHNIDYDIIRRIAAEYPGRQDMIRETAAGMIAKGRKIMPLTLILATGKDGFDALHEKTFAGDG
jgi:hypothetical protein